PSSAAATGREGPPRVASSRPARCKRLSRITSASIRRGFIRQRYALSGSIAWLASLAATGDDCIRYACDVDQPVQPFHVPARLHELDRQPVEQFMMDGTRGPQAEIEDRTDEGLAEMPHPDLVDRHPRGERVLAVGDPAGERQPAPRAGL